MATVYTGWRWEFVEITSGAGKNFDRLRVKVSNSHGTSQALAIHQLENEACRLHPLPPSEHPVLRREAGS